MVSDETASLLTTAGIGGSVACCAVLEALGGAAVVAGIGAALGTAAHVAYLVAVGLGGFLTAALIYGVQSKVSHV